MDNQAGARQPYRIVTPPSAATMACKRAFDILCSFLGLTVLSPVLLVVSVLVAVTSPGGVFSVRSASERTESPSVFSSFAPCVRITRG